jgi:hypothetical protein
VDESNREGIYAAGGARVDRAGGRSLRGRGEIVEAAGTVSGWRLVDPLLTAWVNEGRPGLQLRGLCLGYFGG